MPEIPAKACNRRKKIRRTAVAPPTPAILRIRTTKTMPTIRTAPHPTSKTPATTPTVPTRSTASTGRWAKTPSTCMVTVKDQTVTNVEVIGHPFTSISKKHQNAFAEAINGVVGRQAAQRPQGRQGGRCQLDVGSVQQGVGRGPSGSVDPVGPVAAKSLQTYNERLSYSLTQRVIKGRSGDAHEFQILLRATLLCNAFQAAITGHRTAVMFSGQGVLASPCNALQASMEPSIVLNRNCGSNPLRNTPAFMPRSTNSEKRFSAGTST